MAENIRSSLRGIWSHKLRSFLTILGVIIGIASIIAIVSIVEGTNQKLEKSLIGSGNNVISVSLSQDDWNYEFDQGNPAGVPLVQDDAIKKIKEMSEVEAVTKYRQRQAYNAIYYLNKSVSNGTINGIDKDFFSTMEFSISAGRNFSVYEYAKGAKVAIVDQNIANNLLGGDAVGKIIELKQEPFLVVGVISDDNKNAQEEYETIDDYYNQQSSGVGSQVFIPTEIWPLLFQYDEPETVGARVQRTGQMNSVGKRMSEILNAYISNDSVTYMSANMQDYADDMKTLTNSIQLMLLSIASLSLLVGGIGVMNIMLVSVTERTAEIGLKKALGAKRRTILYQFLTESAVLTSVGGIIGVLAGIGLAKILSVVAALEFGISVPWIIIAVSFSVLIGLVFGAMPALRASKLNPIDALRRE